MPTSQGSTEPQAMPMPVPPRIMSIVLGRSNPKRKKQSKYTRIFLHVELPRFKEYDDSAVRNDYRSRRLINHVRLLFQANRLRLTHETQQAGRTRQSQRHGSNRRAIRRRAEAGSASAARTQPPSGLLRPYDSPVLDTQHDVVYSTKVFERIATEYEEACLIPLAQVPNPPLRKDRRRRRFTPCLE